MLVIRQEQLVALGQHYLGRFKEQLASYLREWFPLHCAAMGESDLRAFIEEGIERAARHGFVLEVDISRFINLMMVLGRRFDVDPQLPWARTILGHEGFPDASTRADVLYEEAKRRMGETP